MDGQKEDDGAQGQGGEEESWPTKIQTGSDDQVSTTAPDPSPEQVQEDWETSPEKIIAGVLQNWNKMQQQTPKRQHLISRESIRRLRKNGSKKMQYRSYRMTQRGQAAGRNRNPMDYMAHKEADGAEMKEHHNRKTDKEKWDMRQKPAHNHRPNGQKRKRTSQPNRKIRQKGRNPAKPLRSP